MNLLLEQSEAREWKPMSVLAVGIRILVRAGRRLLRSISPWWRSMIAKQPLFADHGDPSRRNW